MRLSSTGTQESASTWLQTLSIDTVAPSAPSVPDLNKGDDRGNTYYSTHAADNLVRRANGLSFTGTVTADQNVTAVWLYANNQLLGSTGVNDANTWAFFYPGTAAPLANGTYQITAVAVDRTGNRSLVSTALTLTIDTVVNAPQSLMLVAASDSGASAWQTLWNVIIPLCRTGIIIGSIFVITIVMGDFVTIGVMGGQQIASVGKIIQVQTSYLQFPLAAANAVVLLAIVLMIIWALTRMVDIRKEL